MKLIDADKLVIHRSSIQETARDEGELVFWVYADDIKKAEIVDAIPIEQIKNKRDELKKEYYDLFHEYTDEDKNNQVWLLNDFRAFDTVLRYWEKEND